MLGAPFVDALDRIASRAQDVRDAYRTGAVPFNDDVRSAGTVAMTTDPMSAAAPPGAWFVIRGIDGERAFTRDGALDLRAGVLRNRDGADVLGYPAGDARGTVPSTLRLPETDRALGRAGDARVESDGTVVYTRAAIDPRTGERGAERVVIGRLALARFPAGSAPARLDATRFGAPPGVVPHLGTPGDGTFPPLSTSSRDAGAIDLDTGLQRLSEAYLAFEAIGAAQRARYGVDKTTLDLVK
jgi:hypothetical protein